MKISNSLAIRSSRLLAILRQPFGLVDLPPQKVLQFLARRLPFLEKNTPPVCHAGGHPRHPPSPFAAATVPSINPETSQLISPRTISCIRTRSGAPGYCCSRTSSNSPIFPTASTRLIELNQPCEIAIVEIGCVVGDLVAQIDQLRLQRRLQPGQVFVQASESRPARNRANASRSLRGPQTSGSARETSRSGFSKLSTMRRA